MAVDALGFKGHGGRGGHTSYSYEVAFCGQKPDEGCYEWCYDDTPCPCCARALTSRKENTDAPQAEANTTG